MKKFLRILVIIILLVCAFLLIKKNTTRFNFSRTDDVLNTWTTISLTESDIFVNPDFCKEKNTRQEYIEYRQTDCQKTNSCEQRQQDISGIVFADRYCIESGLVIRVLNTENVSGYDSIIEQWIQEMKTLGKLPRLIYHNILESAVWFDAGFINDTIELTWLYITGTDISRIFISMEGQDLMTPMLNIIIKKWNFIASLQNDLFHEQYVDTPLKPVIDAYASWVNQKINELQASEYTFPGPDLLEYYHQNIEINPYYQQLLQKSIKEAIGVFVAK